MPGEFIEVAGPTVGKAIEQILKKRTRPGKGQILLRMVGGDRLRGLGVELSRGANLEFIHTRDAECRASEVFRANPEHIPDLGEWLDLVKSKDWDVQASLDKVMQKRRMTGRP
jgi:hypothetical protein